MKNIARETCRQNIARTIGDILGTKCTRRFLILIMATNLRCDTDLWTNQMIDSQIRNPSEHFVATDGYILATRFPGYKVPNLPFPFLAASSIWCVSSIKPLSALCMVWFTRCYSTQLRTSELRSTCDGCGACVLVQRARNVWYG